MIVRNPRCEWMTRPTVDTATPRLMWELSSATAADTQTGYQVQVGSSLDPADLWDSGKVASTTQIITYAGAPLAARARLYWRVRVWDAAGAASQWAHGRFDMGLPSLSDWAGAKWIGYQTGGVTGGGNPMAHVRKVFTAQAKGIVRATLYASALGLYRAHINGQRVNQAELAPGWTEPAIRRQYQAIDVTRLVTSGATNALALSLGDGWYIGNLGFFGRGYYSTDMPRGIAALFVDYADGTTDTIVTDGTWKATTSTNRSNDLYMGSASDSRLRIAYSDPGTSDDAWPLVNTMSIGSVPLVVEPMPTTGRCEQLTAQSVIERSGGFFRFDLGQNHAGVPRLRIVNVPKGNTITIRHAEDLNKNGDGKLYTANLREATATDTFISDGSPVQILEAIHTYHGYRYVEMDGISGGAYPVASDLTSTVIHADTVRVSDFACSNDLLNRIWTAEEWSVRSNHITVPTDCCQRNERLGWSADAMITVRTIAYMRDYAAAIGKFSLDMADSATSQDGAGTDVTPMIYLKGQGSGNVFWADPVAMVPYYAWQAYGDTQFIKAVWPVLKRTLTHLPWVENRYKDYLASEVTPDNVLSYGVSYRTADCIRQMALAIGDTATATSAANVAASCLSTWQGFINADGTTTVNTQTSYIIGLNFGLIPASKRAAAAARLASLIEASGLTSGFIGLPYVYDALADNGQIAAAYALATKTTFPSHGYAILSQGCTTIPEQWAPRDYQGQRDGDNSYNHPFRGTVAEWYVRTIVGLDTDPAAPGFAKILVRPRPGGGITWAQFTFAGPRGRIAVSWAIKNGKLILHLEVPPNSTATVSIPPGYTTATTNGSALSSMTGVTAAGTDPVTGQPRYGLRSGTFTITFSA